MLFASWGGFLTDLEDIYPSENIAITICLCQVNESNVSELSGINDNDGTIDSQIEDLNKNDSLSKIDNNETTESLTEGSNENESSLKNSDDITINSEEIDKLGQMSYVLCFGTLVSLYINEQVYSPSEHDGIHRLLIFPLLVGALISFAGMILNSYEPFRMALVVFRVLNILIFFIVSIAYFLKIYDIWKDKEDELKKEIPSSENKNTIE